MAKGLPAIDRGERRWSVTLLACALLAFADAASAEPRSADKERVLALYNEGKELLDRGKVSEACRAFEDAKHLDPAAINLLLRLGDCYERLGRTGSALGEYQRAAAIAGAAGDGRASDAEARARALAPKLARLTITLSKEAIGVTLHRNGALLSPEQIGVAEVIDPGPFTFEASAPGKTSWTAQRLVEAGASVVVIVPALAPIAASIAAPETPAPIVPPAGEGGLGGRKILALGLGGAGLIGAGMGAFFGLRALSDRDASRRDGHCDAQSFCDDAGYQLRKDAQSAGTVSTVAFALGGAALATGAVLWLTAPQSAAPKPIALTFSADPTRGSLGVRGTF